MTFYIHIHRLASTTVFSQTENHSICNNAPMDPTHMSWELGSSETLFCWVFRTQAQIPLCLVPVLVAKVIPVQLV